MQCPVALLKVIPLTPVDPSGLPPLHTRTDFAVYLNDLHRRSGLSLAQLEAAGRRLAGNGKVLRALPAVMVSDVLSGQRPVKKDLLQSLLVVFGVPMAERTQVLIAWQRINASVGQGPADARRVDEVSLRELGVHPAIFLYGVQDELPVYVPRDFDDELRDAIARGAESGCFVLLLGGSSWGKTRSLAEAVKDVVPEWWLVQPAGTREIHDLLAARTERTVVWLDDLDRYFGANPALLKEHVVTLVRTFGLIVVGTLWPTAYFAIKDQPVTGGDGRAAVRLVDFAHLIKVPESFSVDERRRAAEAAITDSRLKTALAMPRVGVTQVLAAAPDLVLCWEQAPEPYSRAMISVAADARRLGVQSPLPADMLVLAMADYLTPKQRSVPVEAWLERALKYATRSLHGEICALDPVSGDQPGQVAGYLVADYLVQHIAGLWRTVCPPESLWMALLDHVRDADDLRRLAGTAFARMRYQYAERAFRRLHEAGDRGATGQLIALLRRQGALGEAIATADAWLADDPADERRRALHTGLIKLRAWAEQLRSRADEDTHAKELLVELLTDGGQAHALRLRVEADDVVAVEDLAEVLADRGCVDELRDLANRGNSFAEDRLDDLLGSLGREEELKERMRAGHSVAGFHLDRLLERRAGVTPHDLDDLRRRTVANDKDATAELITALFDAGDGEGLLAEVNAGTDEASERYLALLTADPAVDSAEVHRIRQFGLPAGPPGADR